MAPFTANVWEIRVKPGDVVKKGDVVMVLEAMKVRMHAWCMVLHGAALHGIAWRWSS